MGPILLLLCLPREALPCPGYSQKSTCSFQNLISAQLSSCPPPSGSSSQKSMLFSRNLALSPRAPELLCTGCLGDVALCEQSEVLGAAVHKQSLVWVVQLLLCTAARPRRAPFPRPLPSHPTWWWELSLHGNVILNVLITELLLDTTENKTLLQKKLQP